MLAQKLLDKSDSSELMPTFLIGNPLLNNDVVLFPYNQRNGIVLKPAMDDDSKESSALIACPFNLTACKSGKFIYLFFNLL